MVRGPLQRHQARQPPSKSTCPDDRTFQVIARATLFKYHRGTRLQELIIAVGLVFVIEGLIYALFPGGMKSMAAQLPQIPDSTLRGVGAAIIAVGVLIVWLAKS